MKPIELIIVLLLTFHMVSAQNAFYYYQGEKIFLKERNDKILLTLSKDVDKSRLLHIIKCVLQTNNTFKTEKIIIVK